MSDETVNENTPDEEITEDVLYGPRSLVWDQAENRLHTQKAIMALVIR